MHTIVGNSSSRFDYEEPEVSSEHLVQSRIKIEKGGKKMSAVCKQKPEGSNYGFSEIEGGGGTLYLM